MVQIISGKKGKGKTKYLLDKVNKAVTEAEGSVVYLDKSAKHMYELSNKVRLINVSEYPITSYEGFLGFICGIISQDHDLEQMYLDSFLKLSNLEGKDITEAITTLDEISEKYNIELTIHMDPIETDNEYVNSLKEEVGKVILPLGLSFHDFRVVEGHTHTNVLFDVVIPRENKITDKEVLALLKQTFKDRNLYFVVHFDGDYFD